MISFKQYILENEKVKEVDGYPVLNTVMGKHSQQDHKHDIETTKDGYPVLNTVMGKHSEKELDEARVKGEYSPAQVEGLHRRLSTHYTFDNPEHKKQIEDFTISSLPINNHLHRIETGQHVSEFMKKRSEPVIKTMDDVTHKHKTPEDMHVWSGIKQSPEHALKSHGDDKGVTVKTTNYTSTSIDKNIAKRFAREDRNTKYKQEGKVSPRHMLKIHIPKGHPGAYVAGHSDIPEEKEFVLPRGTKMHIHPKPERSGSNLIWHAHVLPHEDK